MNFHMNLSQSEPSKITQGKILGTWCAQDYQYNECVVQHLQHDRVHYVITWQHINTLLFCYCLLIASSLNKHFSYYNQVWEKFPLSRNIKLFCFQFKYYIIHIKWWEKRRKKLLYLLSLHYVLHLANFMFIVYWTVMRDRKKFRSPTL